MHVWAGIVGDGSVDGDGDSFDEGIATAAIVVPIVLCLLLVAGFIILLILNKLGIVDIEWVSTRLLIL